MMKRYGGCVALLTAAATFGWAGSAMASNPASGVTSTGQTLTITIDSPTAGGKTDGTFKGHVTLGPLPGGAAGPSSRITRIDYGTNPNFPSGTTQPASDGSFSFVMHEVGLAYVSATAVADEGTRVTADMTVTFPQQTSLLADYTLLDDTALPLVNFPIEYGGAVGIVQLYAHLFTGPPAYATPVPYQPVKFMVGGKVRCTAYTNAQGIATCRDASVALSTLQTDGYDAVYDGSIDWYPASSHARLVRLLGLDG